MPEDDKFTEVKRVTPRPKHWDRAEDGLGRWTGELLTRLPRMRRDRPYSACPACTQAVGHGIDTSPYDNGYGIDTDRQTVVYHRWGNDAAGRFHRHVIALNFGSFSQRISVPFPDGGT